jgi:hypothetical protein
MQNGDNKLTNSKQNPISRKSIPLACAVLFFILLLTFPTEVANGIRQGSFVAYKAIIPAVFPFMVLSEFLTKIDFAIFEQNLGTILAKTFGISPVGCRVVLIGWLSGFPIGARLCCDLRKAEKISDKEAERLLFLSSLCSPAYVINGIGIGMLGNISIGIKLYIILLTSHLLAGLFTFGKTSALQFNEKESTVSVSPFSITEAIEKAADGCIRISAYLAFFSAASSVVSKVIAHKFISSLIASVLEIGGGTIQIISLNSRYSYVILSSSLAFSGISVAMQTRAFAKEGEITMKTYYFGKALSSFIGGGVAYLFLT